MIPSGGDRRRNISQREWALHLLPMIIPLLTLGAPIFVWGMGIQSANAVLQSRLDADDRQIAEFHAYETALTAQMLEVNKQLAAIAGRMDLMIKKQR